MRSFQQVRVRSPSHHLCKSREKTASVILSLKKTISTIYYTMTATGDSSEHSEPQGCCPADETGPQLTTITQKNLTEKPKLNLHLKTNLPEWSAPTPCKREKRGVLHAGASPVHGGCTVQPRGACHQHLSAAHGAQVHSWDHHWFTFLCFWYWSWLMDEQ